MRYVITAIWVLYVRRFQITQVMLRIPCCLE